MDVVFVYPDPGSITSTEVIAPFSIIGVKTDPLPSPLTIRFGIDVYPLPPFKNII